MTIVSCVTTMTIHDICDHFVSIQLLHASKLEGNGPVELAGYCIGLDLDGI